MMLLAFIEITFENILWGILAIVVAYLLKQIITPPPPPPPPRPRPKIIMREYNKEELSKYTGVDPTTPICIGIRGKVYDVSRARAFYGPGGNYGIFAGHDASYALAKGSLELGDLDKPLGELTPAEKTTLDDWVLLFEGKYQCVGWLEGFPPIATPATSS